MRVEYRALVAARKYLVHELLFDHGGWTGVPGLDSPKLYRSLFDSLGEAMATIERVGGLLTQHLLAADPNFHAFSMDGDGVRDLRSGVIFTPASNRPPEPL